MPFQPVQSQRLYERVAHQIGDLIRAGEFGPGDRLPAERDLARMLGVSRPVVREAMIALEVTGLVEVRTGSGAYVKGPPPAQGAPLDAGVGPTDILNARMLVEGEIAALAARQADAAGLALISQTLEEMERAYAEGRSWAEYDLAFHAAIAQATGNAALGGVVDRLWQEQYSPMFSLLSRRVNLTENWAATIAGHRAILNALRARDAKAARRAMHAHLSQVLEVMTNGEG